MLRNNFELISHYKVVNFINLVHWLGCICFCGLESLCQERKNSEGGRKVAFLTLEYIPENEPATKDFTTGLLTNTSILNYFWFDVILFGYFFVFFFVFQDFYFLLTSVLFFHTQYWGHYLLFVVLSFVYQFTLSSNSNPWNRCRKWREAGTISCCNPLGYHPQRQTICSSCSWYS